MIKVVIADDEAPARRRLRELLHDREGFEILGEARNGVETVELVVEEEPDLLLLDIQMPELDGFGVLEALADDELPLTVFVTAYDEHALKAFDVNAVDYLLKPFSDERFDAALERVQGLMSPAKKGEFLAKVEDLVRRVRPAVSTRGAVDRLVVKSTGRVQFVPVNEIRWIQAAGVYVRLHTDDGAILMRETVSALEEQLSARDFVRIHRSTIVAISRLKELTTSPSGEVAAILDDGTKLKVSRGYRESLMERLSP